MSNMQLLPIINRDGADTDGNSIVMLPNTAGHELVAVDPVPEITPKYSVPDAATDELALDDDTDGIRTGRLFSGKSGQRARDSITNAVVNRVAKEKREAAARRLLALLRDKQP